MSANVPQVSYVSPTTVGPAVDGNSVGTSVGAADGAADGATDGAAVGATDGATDGALVGPYVDGALLGPYVSPTTVGPAVDGDAVGTSVGAADGATDGAKDGTSVGPFVVTTHDCNIRDTVAQIKWTLQLRPGRAEFMASLIALSNPIIEVARNCPDCAVGASAKSVYGNAASATLASNLSKIEENQVSKTT